MASKKGSKKNAKKGPKKTLRKSPQKTSGSLVEKYLKEIGEKTETGEYLFRGHSDADWTLTSSAERRIAASIAEGAPIVEVDVPLDSIISSQISLLKEARKLGLGRQDGRDLTDLELLTELQHFDAATVLLDFTENPLVALYFACRKMNEEERNSDMEGKIFCLPRTGLPKATDTLKIGKILRERKMKEWKPFMHGSAERRIIKQSSVFVLNLDVSEAELASVTVCRDEKDELINELSKIYGISTASLYIDLSGFASSRSVGVPYDDEIVNYYQANKKYNEDDYEAAVSFYDRSLDLRPDTANVLYNRGLTKFKLDDLAGALADYDRAIELQHDNVEAHNNRGAARFKSGDLLGAISDYNKVIELNPDMPSAFSNRGTVKYELGDFEGALNDYDKAIKLKPNHAIAFNGRGRVKFKSGDLEGAMADYDRAIEFRPDYSGSLFNRGIVKYELDDLGGAFHDYDRAIELQPDFGNAYKGRGSVKFISGDLSGAIADYDKAIEFDPDDSRVFHSRGNAKVRFEQMNDALSDFNRSIELEENIYNLHSRANLHIRRGEAASAETDFQAMKTKLDDISEYEKRGAIDALKVDLAREKDNDAVIDFIKRCISAVESALES